MGDRLPQDRRLRVRLNRPHPGYPPAMKELTPRDMDDDLESSQEDDELWGEAMSALGLIGSVLLIVLLISLFGRL
jgi:hypothetical protein